MNHHPLCKTDSEGRWVCRKDCPVTSFLVKQHAEALEKYMEKRGVVTDDEKTKTAETTERCPNCGMKLEEPGKCPQEGTEPFERKPDASR